MRSTDRDSEAVATCTGREVDNFFGVGVGVVVGRNFVLNACENAELAFNGYVELMSVVNNFLGEGNVFLVGEVRTVDHNGREAVVDAGFAKLEAVTVVEVEADLGIFPAEFLSVSNSTLSHVAQESSVGIVACAFRNLEDNGRFLFSRSLDDGLELFHVIEVKGRNGISALDGLGKHLASVDQT